MGRLIICTVGTSLITPDEQNPATTGELRDAQRYSGERIKDVRSSVSPWDVLRTSNAGHHDLEKAQNLLLGAYAESMATSSPTSRRVSAEIDSLRKLDPTKEDRIVLLASDTVEGAFTARCVALLCSEGPRVYQLQELQSVENPRNQGLQEQERRGAPDGLRFDAQLHVMLIQHLKSDLEKPDNTGPARDFRERGCYNLAAMVSSLIAFRNTALHGQVICNITGGLKSSFPFVVWVCTLWDKIELVYLYEESKALLRSFLPKMEVALTVRDLVRSDTPHWGPITTNNAWAYFDKDEESGQPVLSLFGRAYEAYLDVCRLRREIIASEALASADEALPANGPRSSTDDV